MAEQIRFFLKNHIDLDRPDPNFTIVDPVAINNGENDIRSVRNRSNSSGWATSGSNDSANTSITVDMGDFLKVDMIMLVEHNFKNATIEYLDIDSATFMSFGSLSDNDKTTSIFYGTNITTNMIRVTINNTILVDDDKFLSQLIITENLLSGQLEGSPQIQNPVGSLNKKVNELLSGKVNVVESTGAFRARLSITISSSENDLNIFEEMNYQREGVLLLISGGDEDQFKNIRFGERNRDIVLVRITNELSLPRNSGVYVNGVRVQINVAEAVR